MSQRDISRRSFVVGSAGAAAAIGSVSTMGSIGAALADQIANYIAGTYTATAPGFGGDVTVTLTVDESAILDCSIEGASETSTVGGVAVQQMPAQILEAQSSEVEGVTGATVTSEAVRTAVADCLAQASGQSVDIPAVLMVPGTYKASAPGHSVVLEVPVTVTVDETTIKGIRVDQCAETGHILDAAKLIIPRICDSQCTAVDAISGATATSNAIKAAVDKCIVQALEAAGTDVAALANFHNNKPAKAHEGETVEYNVDVVVCGMGGTGCAACMRAAEVQADAGRDVSVLGLEVAALYGGTSCATTMVFGVNSQMTDDRYNGGEDMYDLADLKQFVVESKGELDERLDTYWDWLLASTGPSIDWLYSHGFYFGQPRPGFNGPQFDTQFYYCGYQGEDNLATLHRCFDQMIGDYVALGGQYLLETQAYELIYEDGRVAGVRARNVYDGTEYIVHAGAVVIAEGGFGGDPDKMQNWIEGKVAGDWALFGMTQNKGLLMDQALGLGAVLYGTADSLSGNVHNIAPERILTGFPINWIEGQEDAWRGHTAAWSLNDVPNIMCAAFDAPAVYPDGKRHYNEGVTMAWGFDGPQFWSIWSQPQIDAIAENGFAQNNTQLFLCCGFNTFPLNMPIPEMPEIMDAGITQGIIFKADTLEELAEQIGLDSTTFTETIATYNASCAAGEDAEFGKDPQYLVPVEGAPYYAIKAMPRVYSSGGGLRTSPNMEVYVGEEGDEIIPGLYAGGNCALGMFDWAYGGEYQALAYISGATAAEHAMEYVEMLN